MKFGEKIQKQFKKAGWFEERNIAATYENANILRYTDFPQFLKDFLKEYGNLEIEDCKNYQSNVTNVLKLGVAYAGYDKDEYYEQDFAVYGKILYPFGYFYPDGYMIACDETGNIYMLGDYTFLRSNNFKKGIEKLLFDDWSGSLEYDEENNVWKSNENF
jgi:hypothetical protein